MGSCWWMELQYCHREFHYIAKSTREQHSSTTMTAQDKINWKPAAILTETNIFMRFSWQLTEACMRNDLWTLLKKAQRGCLIKCGQWPETMKFVTMAYMTTFVAIPDRLFRLHQKWAHLPLVSLITVMCMQLLHVLYVYLLMFNPQCHLFCEHVVDIV